jgi:ADP-heptose:LPS heptosyltransferase
MIVITKDNNFNMLNDFENKTLLIKRTMAIGDVIMTTPIIRQIKQLTSNQLIIDFETMKKDVFFYNDMIRRYDNLMPIDKYDYVLDLNSIYENQPSKHVIEAYASIAFADFNFDHSYYVPTSDVEKRISDLIISNAGLDNKKFIVFHMAQSGRNRTLSPDFWLQACKLAIDFGYEVINVGTFNDFGMIGKHITDFRGKLSLHQTLRILERASCVIGSDSGMIHLAACTEVPIIGLFTCVKSEYRLPTRHGKKGWNFEAISTPLECYGCRELEPPPVFNNECKYGNYACTNSFTKQMVEDSLVRLLDK